MIVLLSLRAKRSNLLYKSTDCRSRYSSFAMTGVIKFIANTLPGIGINTRNDRRKENLGLLMILNSHFKYGIKKACFY